MTIKTSNIPIMNLQNEFYEYLELIKSEGFAERLFDFSKYPLQVPSMYWSGIPRDLITLMLQRSILGLESYVSAAVTYELGMEISEKTRLSLENPFSLNRNAVVAIYEKLPELISTENKLSKYNQSLFEDLQRFYKEVRNPIFHGNQLDFSISEYGNVVQCFELLSEVYNWIHTWFRAFPMLYTGKNLLGSKNP